QQALADGIVDLVRPGMREILPLQPDVGAPAFGQPRREGQRRGTADPRFQLAPEFLLKIVGVQMLPHTALEPLERRDEGLRYIAAAEGTEATLRVGKFAGNGVGEQTRAIEAQIRS